MHLFRSALATGVSQKKITLIYYSVRTLVFLVPIHGSQWGFCNLELALVADFILSGDRATSSHGFMSSASESFLLPQQLEPS